MGVFLKEKHWFIDYYVRGVRKRERVYGSKRDAERALHKRKIQIMEGRFYEIEKPKKAKFSDFVKRKTLSRRLNFIRPTQDV